MFLYYIYSSGAEFDSDSQSRGCSSCSSRSRSVSGNYPAFILDQEEFNNPKEWKRIKENFLEYGYQDQQRILEKAIEHNEKAFVLQHFFDDDRYSFNDIYSAALEWDFANIIGGIIEGWLSRSRWEKLMQHFMTLTSKLKWRVWRQAIVDEKRDFIKAFDEEMRLLGPEGPVPSLKVKRRDRNPFVDSKVSNMPAPLLFDAREDDEYVEVS